MQWRRSPTPGMGRWGQEDDAGQEIGEQQKPACVQVSYCLGGPSQQSNMDTSRLRWSASSASPPRLSLPHVDYSDRSCGAGTCAAGPSCAVCSVRDDMPLHQLVRTAPKSPAKFGTSFAGTNRSTMKASRVHRPSSSGQIRPTLRPDTDIFKLQSDARVFPPPSSVMLYLIEIVHTLALCPAAPLRTQPERGRLRVGHSERAAQCGGHHSEARCG